MRTLIIGGGAAGLYASSLLPDAVILERNGECGRKLLLTGGGRCNYTHEGSVPDILPHYHGSLPFIRKVLYSHSPDEIIRRFRELGVEPADERGKIFPAAGDAHSILRALTRHRPEIIRGKALEIKKVHDRFTVVTESGEIDAAAIILAAGGVSYPHTGSDGSGYHLAAALGHRVVPPRPALAALSLEPSLSEAEGITAELKISKGKKSTEGTAVITRRGLSGPAAENFSHMLCGKEDITVSFCTPDIKALRAGKGAMLLKNALVIPPRLASALLGEIAEKKIANLSGAEERKAEELLSRHPYKAAAIAAGAMSTAGGISTSEINPETMESRIVPSLYFAGDITDVDADCGGYSLTWAFATAYAAAKALGSIC